jgi:hypothetical protein
VVHLWNDANNAKALLEAKEEDEEDDWPSLFRSTIGLIFFGTPFRGAEGMELVEMLDAARREYTDDQIQSEVLEILRPGDVFLREVVDRFCKTRAQMTWTHIACLYEMKRSNVGAIVGGQKRTVSANYCTVDRFVSLTYG